MRRVIVALALIAAAVGGIIAVLTGSGRLWWRSTKYSVAVQGATADSAVYSGRGVLLVSIHGSFAESYVLYPAWKGLGLAVRGRFISLPGCVLSLDNPATYVPLGKLEIATLQSFTHHSVEFQGEHGETVRIRW